MNIFFGYKFKVYNMKNIKYINVQDFQSWLRFITYLTSCLIACTSDRRTSVKVNFLHTESEQKCKKGLKKGTHILV